METKANKFNNEETVVESKNANFEYSGEEDNVADRETVTNAGTMEKQSNKKVLAAGIGVMAGIAGAFGYNALRAAPAMDENTVASKLGGALNSNVASNPNIEPPESLDDIEIAESPNDEMSFNEAFAVARKEVGPNGVFEWRGNVYGTYYSEEWDNLSDDYKEQFGNHHWKDKMDDSGVVGLETVVGAEDPVNTEESEVAKFEIKNDEDGNEYIVLKDAITGDELHVAPDEFGLAVTDEQGEVIAFLTNDYLAEHPEPNGVIQFDGDGNCITLETMYSGDSEEEFVPEPIDDDVEILNPGDDDVVVPEEFEGEYVALDENGEVVENEVMAEGSDEVNCQDEIDINDIPEIDDDGEIIDESVI